MKRSRSPFQLVFLALALAAVGRPAPAAAAVFRQAVVVDTPAGMTGRAAEIAQDSRAQKALLEAYIRERVSSLLLDLRGDMVRTLLEPAGTLLEKFTVVSRDDSDATHVRVICEADVDTAAVILRLVNGRVLTFGKTPPRVLFLAADGTSPTMLQSLRARVTDTLGAAGIVLLAPEATATSVQVQSHLTPTQVQVITSATAESRADLIASVSFSANSIPSPIGGVILDATVQYTLIRPRDNSIVAEQVFSARGSGASKDLAERSVMDQLGPQIARGMAGRLGEAIFSDGNVIDPDGRLSNTLTLNVFARPSAAATKALMDLLRGKQWTVTLGDSAMAQAPSISNPNPALLGHSPADRLIVTGQVTVTQLYDTFAAARFGDGNALQASVVEYGDDYIGIEIIDRNKHGTLSVPIPAITIRPPEPKPKTATPPPTRTAGSTPSPLEFVKTAWAPTKG